VVRMRNDGFFLFCLIYFIVFHIASVIVVVVVVVVAVGVAVVVVNYKQAIIIVSEWVVLLSNHYSGY